MSERSCENGSRLRVPMGLITAMLSAVVAIALAVGGGWAGHMEAMGSAQATLIQTNRERIAKQEAVSDQLLKWTAAQSDRIEKLGDKVDRILEKLGNGRAMP